MQPSFADWQQLVATARSQSPCDCRGCCRCGAGCAGLGSTSALCPLSTDSVYRLNSRLNWQTSRCCSPTSVDISILADRVNSIAIWMARRRVVWIAACRRGRMAISIRDRFSACRSLRGAGRSMVHWSCGCTCTGLNWTISSEQLATVQPREFVQVFSNYRFALLFMYDDCLP